MNFKNKRLSILFILLLSFAILLTVSHIAQAEQGNLYSMTGSVGAGGMNTAGVYQTDVIIGQTAVSQQAAGSYDLGSGFWGGGLVVISVDDFFIFLPTVLK